MASHTSSTPSTLLRRLCGRICSLSRRLGITRSASQILFDAYPVKSIQRVCVCVCVGRRLPAGWVRLIRASKGATAISKAVEGQLHCSFFGGLYRQPGALNPTVRSRVDHKRRRGPIHVAFSAIVVSSSKNMSEKLIISFHFHSPFL